MVGANVIFALPMLLIWLASLVLGIYVLTLLIKFLKTGTRAFELYIENNKNNHLNLDDFREN